MAEPKLRRFSDWLLLSQGGEWILIALLLGFCFAVVGSALLIGIQPPICPPEHKQEIHNTIEIIKV